MQKVGQLFFQKLGMRIAIKKIILWLLSSDSVTALVKTETLAER